MTPDVPDHKRPPGGADSPAGALIERWLAEFADADGYERFARPLRRKAPEVLRAFLAAACRSAGALPPDLDAADLRAGLWNGTLPLALPESARRKVPDLCAALLRWADAAKPHPSKRAAAVENLASAYVRAAGLPDDPPPGASSSPSPEGSPPRGPRPVKGAARPPRADGRARPNQPCPCGSGRKFKKCCGRDAAV